MMKNPVLAAVLSIVPGMGHVYLGGNTKKAIALFCIDIGVLIGAVFSQSYVIRILIIFVYALTAVSAVIESYQLAKSSGAPSSLDAQWYVLLMLLMTGFSALPLLWQSSRFTQKAKIVWTVLVILLAVLFFTSLAFFGPRLETFLRNLQSQS